MSALDDLEIIGVARDGLALMDIAAHLNPDVVVTDFKMPGLSGIEGSYRLLELGLCKAVVLLTMYADRHLVDGALEAGIGVRAEGKGRRGSDPGNPKRTPRGDIRLLVWSGSGMI